MNIKTLWLFFFALKISSLDAQNFYVSEIFLNTGSVKDYKSQWLELHNFSEYSIIINKLKIEIQEGSKTPRVIETSIKPPLIFDDRLIIAHQKNLSLGTRLNIAQIALKDFHINKAKKLKICVEINQVETSCLSLSSNLFHEGASLYRSAQNLWRAEPCELMPGIYATPGLPERACVMDPDFSNDLLNTCEEPKALLNRKGSKPFISSALISPSNNLTLRFSDDDPSDLWRLSFCSAPATSKLVCHELSTALSLEGRQENIIKLPEYSQQSNKKLRVLIRDLDGLSDSADLIGDSPKSMLSYKQEHIQKKIINSGKNRFSLELKLRAEEVPVNAQILALSGEVLAQGAFINAGIHNMLFNTSDSAAKLRLTSKNQNELINLELKHEHEIGFSSCTTHDSNFLYLFVYLAFIIKRTYF